MRLRLYDTNPSFRSELHGRYEAHGQGTADYLEIRLRPYLVKACDHADMLRSTALICLRTGPTNGNPDLRAYGLSGALERGLSLALDRGERGYAHPSASSAPGRQLSFKVSRLASTGLLA